MSDREIRSASLDTRLYHDLGLYGDSAWSFVEEFETVIDMTEFNFDHYFPSEFYGQTSIASIVISLIPFANWLHRKKRHFKPLSLRMVAESIELGFWIEREPTKSSNMP